MTRMIKYIIDWPNFDDFTRVHRSDAICDFGSHRQIMADENCAEVQFAAHFFQHIGLYAYRNAFLQAYPQLALSPLEQTEALEQLRVLWHGYPIAVHVTQNAPAAGVDTPEDLVRVRLILGQQI